MTRLTKRALLDLGVCTPVAGCAPLIKGRINPPKNLQEKLYREGLTLISGNKKSHWYSKLMDHWILIKEKVPGILDDPNIERDTEAVRVWCESEALKEISEEDYKSYSSICSENVKSMLGKLAFDEYYVDGLQMDWDEIYKENSGDAQLSSRLSQISLGKDQTGDGDENAYKLMTLCLGLFDEDYVSKTYDQVRRWCIPKNPKVNPLSGSG